MIDIDYMKLAINLAKEAYNSGEVPVGAVVVDWSDENEPKIVGKAFNMREAKQSPAAHAEVLAIEQASKNLNTWRLTNCTVYVTLEPCIMCTGLMHQARIKECVFGAYDKKAGAVSSLYQINQDERLNHNFKIKGGVLHDECATLLKDFFRSRR